MQSARVFISYSHDSDGHRMRVAELANSFRQDGIDCWIDQFEPHPTQGWPQWMEQQIERADFVLLVCTERYLRRFNGHEVFGVGRGVIWESILIRNELYGRGHVNNKFIVVGFAQDFQDYIPARLKGETHYQLNQFSLQNQGYASLYRHLTAQVEVQSTEIGKVVRLPALAPKDCIATVKGIRGASRLLLRSLLAPPQGSSPRHEAAYALRFLGFDSEWPAVSEFILENEFWMFNVPKTDPYTMQFVFDDFRVQRYALRTKRLVPFALWVVDENVPSREIANDSYCPVLCVEGIAGLRDFLNGSQLFGPGSLLARFATLTQVLFDESANPSQRLESNITHELRKRLPGEAVGTTAIFWNMNSIPAHHGNAINGSASMEQMVHAANLQSR